MLYWEYDISGNLHLPHFAMEGNYQKKKKKVIKILLSCKGEISKQANMILYYFSHVFRNLSFFYNIASNLKLIIEKENHQNILKTCSPSSLCL